MPWMETDPMKERERFVVDARSKRLPFVRLCARYGISPKTGYKWLNRFEEEGLEGLRERSRAPHRPHHQLGPFIADAILATKRKHPTWGARKILHYLRNQGLSGLPVESTANALLDRHGLVNHSRRRKRPLHPGKPLVETVASNDVWTADYKGQFKTQDGVYCYPLTIADLHSRYLLACKGHLGTRHVYVQSAFERLFRVYGLPLAILTDNGVPFWAPSSYLRYSELGVWFVTLGIEPLRTELSSPQQNGAHERMHKTLKAEATKPPSTNLKSQQKRFDRWRTVYNDERPHEFHDGRPPSSFYEPSPRPYPTKIQGPEYPGHFEVRKVNGNSTFRFKSGTYYLSRAFMDHDIGLEEVEDGIWDVHFYHVHLARFDERDKTDILKF